MTEFDITLGGGFVNFFPSSAEAEILQNVRTILTTRKGTVPLDRNFGLSQEFLDRPLPVAQAMLNTDIIDQIRTYEPRAQVISVGFDPDLSVPADGKLVPRVRIGVNN